MYLKESYFVPPLRVTLNQNRIVLLLTYEYITHKPFDMREKSLDNLVPFNNTKVLNRFITSVS